MNKILSIVCLIVSMGNVAMGLIHLFDGIPAVGVCTLIIGILIGMQSMSFLAMDDE